MKKTLLVIKVALAALGAVLIIAAFDGLAVRRVIGMHELEFPGF